MSAASLQLPPRYHLLLHQVPTPPIHQTGHSNPGVSHMPVRPKPIFSNLTLKWHMCEGQGKQMSPYPSRDPAPSILRAEPMSAGGQADALRGSPGEQRGKCPIGLCGPEVQQSAWLTHSTTFLPAMLWKLTMDAV